MAYCCCQYCGTIMRQREPHGLEMRTRPTVAPVAYTRTYPLPVPTQLSCIRHQAAVWGRINGGYRVALREMGESKEADPADELCMVKIAQMAGEVADGRAVTECIATP